MPNVVFDASSLVGALLRQNSIPEQALLLALDPRQGVRIITPAEYVARFA